MTIDPRRTRYHLKATYGPDLAGVETTSTLASGVNALAAVNASFFTFTASVQYPGDPVGLGIYDGRLLSEPTADPAEADLVVDSRTNRMVLGRLHWTGTIGDLPIDYLNHPPAADETVRFTPEFAATTPAGDGFEIVLNRHGCVVRTAATRGTALTAGQTSIQATGADAAGLALLATTGCPRQTSSLTDENGKRIRMNQSLFGVNGRYRLVADGEIVVPAGTGSFFARNPRTIAGTTRSGKILLVTIDGRMTTSVGTTMDETAAVAKALGLHDAINLDGGGSTAMVARGALINQPSGGSERAVGDALVLTSHP